MKTKDDVINRLPLNSDKLTQKSQLQIVSEQVSLSPVKHFQKFKMYTEICSVCKNKFSSENKYIQDDSELHSDCIPRKISNHITKKKRRLARTSTPIQELENSAPSSTSDSVTDFFYQSWKSGLRYNETTDNQEEQEQQQEQEQEQQQEQQQIVQMPQEQISLQTVYNPAQVVFVNTVIFQPLITPTVFQQVGFMPDGTFGILTTYLPCNVNFPS